MIRFMTQCTFITLLAFNILPAGVRAVSYFGGTGDDAVTSAAFASDGSIIIGGTSTSATLAGATGTRLADGDGFVAKLDRRGAVIRWLVRLPAVNEVAVGAQDIVYVLLERSVSVIAADGSAWLRQGGDLGASTVDMDAAPDGSVAVLAGDNARLLSPDGSEVWNESVGRSHPFCIAIDPIARDVWVGGDQNTNTGFEPWRSPFLFRYAAATGDRTAVLWNWPGPAVREDGKQLQSDSFITYLRFSEDGRLWIGAGSDGGNTVLTKKPDNLDLDQDALSGTCFSSPCFGYKGAKKTGMFARMTANSDDMERGSWIVPYDGMDPGSHHDPPCGCKGSNFQGTGVNPGSFIASGILTTSMGVIILGNPWGKGPVTPEGWFYNTVYPGGGIGWMGVFSGDLTQITQASMIPGTRDALGAYQGGRLVVAGRAADLSEIAPDPAEAGWHVGLPVTQDALQHDFAGGASDGYFLLACMTTEEQCNSTTASIPGQSPKNLHGMKTPIITGNFLLLRDAPVPATYTLLTPGGRIISSGSVPSDHRITLDPGKDGGLFIMWVSGNEKHAVWRIISHE